ncbi:keto-hydroxyglutarate-aldolase/keto-deoxy-phosphogluconate aldolase [compost metagenome]
MPTGGVTLEETNLKAWFDAGVDCVGIGSHLFSKNVLAHLSYEKAFQVFKQLIEIVRKSRTK